jgi:hypothetical protein
VILVRDAFVHEHGRVRSCSITCVAIPRLGPDPEIFLFHGGFDAPETMTDPTKEAGFLAFLYPLSEAASVRERLGSRGLRSETVGC